MENKITIPYNFSPRAYQLPLLKFLDDGGKRALCVWHRRAGKDVVLWNYMILRALREVGVYYYFLPEYTQAKKIIWDGINNDGFRFLDYCPEAITKNKNGVEMKIELTNGSIIQLIGTDRYDSVRGTNPKGCVFSEFAFQNPMAWEVVKPILKVNGGWAVFNSTPNGKNHFYDLYEMARDNEDWFCERLTISDTGVLGASDIEDERREGMSEEMLQQEYYCSFDIGALGAYYSEQIKQMREEERLCLIPIDRVRDTDVFLDLGKNDSTTIAFLQVLGKELRIVDYYENTGEDVAHYADVIKKKGYNIKSMHLPHDAFAKRLESPKTIAEQFKDYGFKIKKVRSLDVNAGIQQVRKLFPQFWIDKERCKQLVRALENYHHEWDEVKKIFRDYPLHDWSSHAADCIRYLSIGVNEELPQSPHAYQVAIQNYNESQKPIVQAKGGNIQEYRKTMEKYNLQD